MTSYLSGFVDFVGAHPHYALTAVFLLALSEAIPVIGTVVPGSTLIVGISALATGADVNPWLETEISEQFYTDATRPSS
jgi:membrane protein DedA with SNARE-associated domain